MRPNSTQCKLFLCVLPILWFALMCAGAIAWLVYETDGVGLACGLIMLVIIAVPVLLAGVLLLRPVGARQRVVAGRARPVGGASGGGGRRRLARPEIP